MSLTTRFQRGQTVLLREIWRDRVWSARPVIVVQDNPELMAFYLPEGTVLKQPMTPYGSRVTVDIRVRAEWVLQDVEWVWGRRLRLVIPGIYYSVLIFWNSDDDSLWEWYINLEDPLRRTPMGFDYLDQFLDIVVSPDLSEWHWKDEDEMEVAESVGLMSPEKASTIRAEGEKAVTWLQSGKSPFNGWEKWHPDPSWQIPVLPEGWDII